MVSYMPFMPSRVTLVVALSFVLGVTGDVMSVSSIDVVVVFVFFFFKQCQEISSRRISWLSFAN